MHYHGKCDIPLQARPGVECTVGDQGGHHVENPEKCRKLQAIREKWKKEGMLLPVVC